MRRTGRTWKRERRKERDEEGDGKKTRVCVSRGRIFTWVGVQTHKKLVRARWSLNFDGSARYSRDTCVVSRRTQFAHLVSISRDVPRRDDPPSRIDLSRKQKKKQKRSVYTNWTHTHTQGYRASLAFAVLCKNRKWRKDPHFRPLLLLNRHYEPYCDIPRRSERMSPNRGEFKYEDGACDGGFCGGEEKRREERWPSISPTERCYRKRWLRTCEAVVIQREQLICNLKSSRVIAKKRNIRARNGEISPAALGLSWINQWVDARHKTAVKFTRFQPVKS